VAAQVLVVVLSALVLLVVGVRVSLVSPLGSGGGGGLTSCFTRNHDSPDHVGPGSRFRIICLPRSLYCSTKSSVVPSALCAIVLL
jgi:hypothetical protein